MNARNNNMTRMMATAGAVLVLLAAGQAADAQLISGQPQVVHGGFHSNQLFFIDVADHAQSLTFDLTGGAGDADIFVRQGGVGPWAWSSLQPGNHEHVGIVNPPAGRWWIRVYGHSAFHHATLVANVGAAPNTPASILGQAAGIIGPMLMDRLNNRGDGDPRGGNGGDRPDVRLRTLTPGQWARDIRSDDDRVEVFAVTVPENSTRLTVETRGGDGNCIMAVRRGGAPGLNASDATSAQPGTTQRVAIDNPQAGTYYVRLIGAPRFRDVSIRATVDAPPPANPVMMTLPDGTVLRVRPVAPSQPAADLRSDPDVPEAFAVTVPAGIARLTVRTSGGQGGCVMLVRRGGLPTMDNNDGSSTERGTAQQVVIDRPGAATYYVRLLGSLKFRGVTLDVTMQTLPDGPRPAATPLGNAVPQGNLAGPAGSAQLFTLTFSQPISRLTVSTSGGQGECWLLVRRGAPPTLQQHDWATRGTGTERLIDVASDLPAGTWYIMLYTATGFRGVELTASGQR